MKKFLAGLILTGVIAGNVWAEEVITYDTVDGLSNVGEKTVTTTTVEVDSDNLTIESILEDIASEVTHRATLLTQYDTDIAASLTRQALKEVDIAAFRDLGIEEVE